MKFSRFLVGTLACTLFAACSNEENPAVDSGTQGQEGEQAFIAVNLVAPDAMSRAFQDGEPEENAVTSARFYFFNNDGNPVTVSGSVNYITANVGTGENQLNFGPAGTNDEDGNIEEISNTILVLNASTGFPDKMAVILNPPTALDDKSKTLVQLSASGDYSTTTNFIMSSAVYKTSTDNATVDAVAVRDNIAPTSDAAEANPVKVYVERVLARVDVKQDDKSLQDYKDDTEVDASDIEGQATPTDDRVMAVVKGWALANCSDKSYLIKQLNTSWVSSGTTPFTGWNAENYHRSYWAECPDDKGMKTNKTYTEILNASTDMSKSQYCQERTNESSTPTELVVIAELQVDGTRTTIAKYADEYWTVDALLEQFANMISNIYYKATGSEDWKALDKSILKFRPRKSSETSVAYYESVLDLTETAQNYSFASDATGNTSMKVEDVQAVLDDFTPLVWYEGKTYYHLPIEHKIGNMTAINGVVRNHLYNISITGISGLGTPIPGNTEPGEDPDPEEPIDPEDPQDEYSYVAAQINILSWNVVTQSAVLGQQKQDN